MLSLLPLLFGSALCMGQHSVVVTPDQPANSTLNGTSEHICTASCIYASGYAVNPTAYTGGISPIPTGQTEFRTSLSKNAKRKLERKKHNTAESRPESSEGSCYRSAIATDTKQAEQTNNSLDSITSSSLHACRLQSQACCNAASPNTPSAMDTKRHVDTCTTNIGNRQAANAVNLKTLEHKPVATPATDTQNSIVHGNSSPSQSTAKAPKFSAKPHPNSTTSVEHKKKYNVGFERVLGGCYSIYAPIDPPTVPTNKYLLDLENQLSAPTKEVRSNIIRYLSAILPDHSQIKVEGIQLATQLNSSLNDLLDGTIDVHQNHAYLLSLDIAKLYEQIALRISPMDAQTTFKIRYRLKEFNTAFDQEEQDLVKSKLMFENYLLLALKSLAYMNSYETTKATLLSKTDETSRGSNEITQAIISNAKKTLVDRSQIYNFYELNTKAYAELETHASKWMDSAAMANAQLQEIYNAVRPLTSSDTFVLNSKKVTKATKARLETVKAHFQNAIFWRDTGFNAMSEYAAQATLIAEAINTEVCTRLAAHAQEAQAAMLRQTSIYLYEQQIITEQDMNKVLQAIDEPKLPLGALRAVLDAHAPDLRAKSEEKRLLRIADELRQTLRLEKTKNMTVSVAKNKYLSAVDVALRAITDAIKAYFSTVQAGLGPTSLEIIESADEKRVAQRTLADTTLQALISAEAINKEAYADRCLKKTKLLLATVIADYMLVGNVASVAAVYALRSLFFKFSAKSKECDVLFQHYNRLKDSVNQIDMINATTLQGVAAAHMLIPSIRSPKIFKQQVHNLITLAETEHDVLTNLHESRIQLAKLEQQYYKCNIWVETYNKFTSVAAIMQTLDIQPPVASQGV